MPEDVIKTETQIDDELCAKVVQIHWLRHRYLADGLAGLDLTVPQFYTLVTLINLGGNTTMGELAHASHQMSATMTGIIDRLARDDLVERGRSDGDRRTVWVAITPKGRAQVEKALEKTVVSLSNIFSNMNLEEKDSVNQFLDSYSFMMENQPGYSHPSNTT